MRATSCASTRTVRREPAPKPRLGPRRETRVYTKDPSIRPFHLCERLYGHSTSPRLPRRLGPPTSGNRDSQAQCSAQAAALSGPSIESLRREPVRPQDLPVPDGHVRPRDGRGGKPPLCADAHRRAGVHWHAGLPLTCALAPAGERHLRHPLAGGAWAGMCLACRRARCVLARRRALVCRHVRAGGRVHGHASVRASNGLHACVGW